ncbi:MAG TPA: hypothetical protein VFI87_14060 [Hyphomicrobiaceae bacterium]|nr:hypothetical protein [Hyphomicrobiaceae bacterium]
MRSPAQFLNASEAAKQIGVSAKALRLYERRQHAPKLGDVQRRL